MTECPMHEQLEQLLAGALGDEHETALCAHLWRCLDCRELLERMTAPPVPWPAPTGNGRPEGPSELEVGFSRFLAATSLPPWLEPEPASVPSWPVVPGYLITSELGRGGLGVVYAAQHLGLKRRVALKMMQAGARARPIDVARFRREAEALGRLHHPNIVEIYDAGELNGQPWLSMELIEGCTLKHYLAGTPQAPHVAAGLVATLASAVGAMHQQGILHRDLKPNNILLAGGWNHRDTETQRRPQESAVEGPANSSPSSCLLCVSVPLWFNSSSCIPKITDFGLAKDLCSQADLTASREVLGTPSYLAPEQAQATRGKLGPATDVYALGAILYEMLTGRPPFRGSTEMDTLVQVVFEEAVSPRHLVPTVPRDLETICLKCLEKEPQNRYATAAALADDLRRFLQGRPIQARPLGWSGRLLRWGRRERAKAGLSAALLVLLLALALAGPVVASRQARLVQQADESRALAEAQREQAEKSAARALAEKRRADHNLRLAQQALEQLAESRALLAGLLQDWHSATEVKHSHETLQLQHRLIGDSPNDLFPQIPVPASPGSSPSE
jgi:serine/threonine protein kinase